MKLVIFGTILQKRNVDKIAFILVDQNFPSLPQSIAAYQLVQSFLLYKVCSSPVRVSQLPENQALADLKNGSESTGALSDKLSSLLELHEEDRQRSRIGQLLGSCRSTGFKVLLIHGGEKNVLGGCLSCSLFSLNCS